MALRFNVQVRKRYEPNKYAGIYFAKKMPEVLADDRVPISVAEFMQLRLSALDLFADSLENPKKYNRMYRTKVAKFFKDVWGINADTGDAALYNPDGRIKIDLDSELIRKINPAMESELLGGAIRLPSGLYEVTDNKLELTKTEVQKFANMHQKENETLDNRFWRIFARNPNEVPSKYAEDPNLLKNYAKAVNRLANIVFSYDTTMGVYVTDASKDSFTLRPWYVRRLRGGSGAEGRDDLVYSIGRLVGVAPEAPRLAVPSTERLEQIIATITKHSPEVKRLLAA